MNKFAISRIVAISSRTFAPTAKGQRQGTLTVINNGSSGPRTVSLSGKGK